MKSLCRCGGTKTGGKCDRCRPHRAKTTVQYGYDNTWRKLSERYRLENPLCVDCHSRGKVKPATEVHHLRKISEAPGLRLDPANLVSLCRACHRDRTDRGE